MKNRKTFTKEELGLWYKKEINHFKEYLDKYGSDFSRTTEFLSFYALSYVDNPMTHNSFAKLFSKDWLKERRSTLKKFIQKEFPERRSSKIEKIVNFYIDHAKVDISELSSKLNQEIGLKHTKYAQTITENNERGNDSNTFSREKSNQILYKETSQSKSLNIINSPIDQLK